MRAILLATVVLVFLAMMLLAVPPNGNKITICHVPPGNADNVHEITINVSALPAHIGVHCGVTSKGKRICDGDIIPAGGCYIE